MAVLSRSTYVLAVVDALIISFVAFLCFAPFIRTYVQLFSVILIPLAITMLILGFKGFYKFRIYTLKDVFKLLEGVFLASFLSGLFVMPIIRLFGVDLVLIYLSLVFISTLITRTIYYLYKKFVKPVKNILIVGAGQDGKLIAEEIQSRPELGMKVVGFLDDNMLFN